MALSDDIMGILRVTDVDFEPEIEILIEAAKAELIERGVNPQLVLDADALDDANPLVKAAIVFYCKSRFSFDNSDKTFFQNAFNQTSAGLLNSESNIAAGGSNE